MSDTSPFLFSLAASKDESSLRAFLRNHPIPGGMEVAFEREPDFFAASGIRGDLNQTILVRDLRNGQIAGIASRSVAKAFVNGQPTDVGYLSDLRLDTSYQRGTLVARGYRFLKRLHDQGSVHLYTTAIFSDNQQALDTVAAGRAGLPAYHPMGSLNCSGINIRKPKPAISANCSIERGSKELLPQIVECLNRNNARKQFAPVHTCEAFLHAARWRGFHLSDFYVAMRDNQVIGVVGKWDQHEFKQTRIVRYRGSLRWLAPLAKLLNSLAGGHRFPLEGERLSYFNVSFVAIDNDDLQVFRALLRALYRDACSTDAMYGIVSLHKKDPLVAALSEYSLTPFLARLFCVCYNDGEAEFRNLDQRVPYVEAATF